MNSFPKGKVAIAPVDRIYAKEVADHLGLKEPLSQEFLHVAFMAARVFDHKQSRYGSQNIAEFGETGVLIRATDKIKRLINLFRKGIEPTDESKEDSYGDLANYGIIALMCRYGLWPGVESAYKCEPGAVTWVEKEKI